MFVVSDKVWCRKRLSTSLERVTFSWLKSCIKIFAWFPLPRTSELRFRTSIIFVNESVRFSTATTLASKALSKQFYMFTAQFCYYKHHPSSERQMELVKLSPGQIGRFLLRTLLVLCWRSFTTVPATSTATSTTGHLHSWAWRQRCYRERRSNMAWEWRAN